MRKNGDLVPHFDELVPHFGVFSTSLGSGCGEATTERGSGGSTSPFTHFDKGETGRIQQRGGSTTDPPPPSHATIITVVEHYLGTPAFRQRQFTVVVTRPVAFHTI